jgi:quinoprotein glucose dehydrogenase
MSDDRRSSRAGSRLSPLLLLAPLVFVLAVPAPVPAQHGAPGGEWPAYAGDYGSTKYSPLDQIDRGNVDRLEVLWTWESIDGEVLPSLGEKVWHGGWEATPLEVGGVLYVVTPLNQVAALDAATGRPLWRYDPESYRSQTIGPNKGFIHRGLAYWSEGAEARLVYATVDAYLIALDARTGKPIASFGNAGKVDLTQGLRKPVARDGRYGVNSPVVICREVIVVGSSVMDGVTHQEGIPGDVRGFDLRTGEQLWTFHTVAQQGETGYETWEDGSAEYSGSANVWAPYSADEELGYVYLPVTAPTNDFYGGHRLGDNLFSQSLVALEAKTGKRVWHFQMVHHDIWDYDLPAAPNLVDIRVDGRDVKAVAQLSKQGFTYVFDRATGKPVWPIEERTVPQSSVPGERTSPTQPFPTKPPPFARQGIGPDDLIDFTPEIKAAALAILEQYEHGPLFQPPSERGTIVLPGWGGGANWNGGAFDPETGVLYVPSLEMPSRLQMGKPDPARSDLRYRTSASVQIEGPFGLPLVKPPYARLTAIDLNRGELLWSVPHGSPSRPGELDRLEQLTPELRGKLAPLLDGRAVGNAIFSPPLLTRTLLFVGIGRSTTSPVGRGVPLFQAFDKTTGRVVWERELPGHTTGGPMTYLANGRQVIVVAIGGGRGAPVPATLIALGLPASALPAGPTAAAAGTPAGALEGVASKASAGGGGAAGGAAANDTGAAANDGRAPAVDLALVKISERQKSDQLCPVHLVPSAPEIAAWTWEGVTYRGHGAECEAEFRIQPALFAERARRERWVNNFKAQMSTIWCPLMNDQINTGGRKQWTHGGLTWESCCAFCDETEPTDEDFARALEALDQRARFAFELTGGRYVEGAASPVEGAMTLASERVSE